MVSKIRKRDGLFLFGKVSRVFSAKSSTTRMENTLGNHGTDSSMAQKYIMMPMDDILAIPIPAYSPLRYITMNWAVGQAKRGQMPLVSAAIILIIGGMSVRHTMISSVAQPISMTHPIRCSHLKQILRLKTTYSTITVLMIPSVVATGK